MKLVIYTTIFGKGDTLKPIKKFDGVDCILFTDELYSVDGWENRVVELELEERRNARMYKTLAHKYLPEYDYWLWIDGSCEVLKDLREKIENDWLKEHDIAARKHQNRQCLYKEAQECIKQKKDTKAIITKQMDKYLAEAYPPGNGLVDSSVLVRRNTEQVRELNEAWWKEIEDLSKRDQISFPYICWKLGVKYKFLNIKNYIKKERHRKRK